MRLLNRLFRIPRPKSFLYFMTLRTGTELSILALLVNKITGLYGILALFTGVHLAASQLSMYLYSIVALILVTYLARHIRTQDPFECLALATFFLLDSIVNAAYTALFALTWFLVVSRQKQQKHGDELAGLGKGFGGNTMDKAAGFTSPEHNVSSVDVIAAPDQGIPGHKQAAVIAGNPSDAASTGVGDGSLSGALLQPEGMGSIFVICLLWLIRFYLVLVVMAYARNVLRRYVSSTSRTNMAFYRTSKDVNSMDNPFEAGALAGKGWKGTLGRFMIALNKNYWLGVDGSDDAWDDIEVAMGRLHKPASGGSLAGTGVSSPVADMLPGVVERERRRRSGTGPPPPPPQLQQQALPGHHPRVQEIREGK